VELQRDLEDAGERDGATLHPAGVADDAAALVGKAPAMLALGLLAFALLTPAPDSAVEWPAERFPACAIARVAWSSNRCP
jgi:hypothetical protein